MVLRCGLHNPCWLRQQPDPGHPDATTTYYVRFEGDCNTTAAQSVTVNIKDISVAPASATVDRQRPLPFNRQHCSELLRRNPWHQCHGRMVLRCRLHNQCWLRQQPDPGHPDATTTYFVRFEGDCNTTAAQSVTVNIKDIPVAPSSASVDRTVICASDGDIVLSYSGGNPGTGGEARWYSDATFTTLVGTGNGITVAAPSVTTTLFRPF